MAARHLILIDSSGFAYRAFHAGANGFKRYRPKDGMPTGTVIAFLEMLHRLLGEAARDPASHVAAVFDHPSKTFRHKLFPPYKGQRQERDPELSIQLPVMRDAARALGITPVELEGFEADDVIATLARMGVEAGLFVTIVSSDKDMGQLVHDGRVAIVDPYQKARVLAAGVEKKFGVPPHLVPDVQALSGDTVDNIPGVPGIGGVLAGRLVRKLGSLDAVLAEAAKKTGYRMTAGAKLAIHAARKDVKLFHQLTTLDRHAPITETLDDLVATPMNPAHLKELLRALDAGDALQRILQPGPPSTAPAMVQHTESPLAWHALALAEYQKKLKTPSHRITLMYPPEPQVGWYKRKLVKDGPWVPARIWCERAVDFETDQPGDKAMMFCTVGDDRKSAQDQWNRLLNYPISEADYEYLMAHRAWVKTYAPMEPEAQEGEPIDWNKVPI